MPSRLNRAFQELLNLGRYASATARRRQIKKGQVRGHDQVQVSILGLVKCSLLAFRLPCLG